PGFAWIRAVEAAGNQSVDKSCNSFTVPAPAQNVVLTIAKAGTGSGTVTSTPAGITWGTSCSGSYASGTAVTLTATPAAGSTFTGWSGGGCSGTGPAPVRVT